VSRFIIDRDNKISLPPNETTTGFLPRLGSEMGSTEMPLDLLEEIEPTIHASVEFPKPKKQKLTFRKKVGVGLGVTVPIILLLLYQCGQLTVTCNS